MRALYNPLKACQFPSRAHERTSYVSEFHAARGDETKMRAIVRLVTDDIEDTITLVESMMSLFSNHDESEILAVVREMQGGEAPEAASQGGPHAQAFQVDDTLEISGPWFRSMELEKDGLEDPGMMLAKVRRVDHGSYTGADGVGVLSYAVDIFHETRAGEWELELAHSDLNSEYVGIRVDAVYIRDFEGFYGDVFLLKL